MNNNSSISVNRFPLWLVLLGAVVATGPLTIDMYLPALPAIADNLDASMGQVQATLASYFVGLSLGQIVYGPLSDRFGRKGPLLWGLILYTAASVVCALANDVVALIGLRFVQAMGGAAGMVITRAIVRDRCQTQDAARAFSSLMLVMGVAPILAPVIGGLILGVANWRWIFGLLALYGAVVSVCVAVGMQESISEKRLNALQPRVILSTFAQLFKERDFLGFTLSNGLAWCGLFAYIVGSPFVLIQGFGFSEQQYAYVFGMNAAGLILFSQFNVWLLTRFRLSAILACAMWVPLFASALMLLWSIVGTIPHWMVLLGLFVYIASLGLISPNGAALAMQNQMKVAASASALMGALQFGLASVVGYVMSLIGSQFALPLIVVMTFCGASALWVYRRTADYCPPEVS